MSNRRARGAPAGASAALPTATPGPATALQELTLDQPRQRLFRAPPPPRLTDAGILFFREDRKQDNAQNHNFEGEGGGGKT